MTTGQPRQAKYRRGRNPRDGESGERRPPSGSQDEAYLGDFTHK